jgi:hypothetical protein
MKKIPVEIDPVAGKPTVRIVRMVFSSAHPMPAWRILKSPVNRASFRGGRICLALCPALLLVACQAANVVGLVPVYPPVEIQTFSLYGDFVEVDSLQPTFQWQPFTLSEEAAADKTIGVEEIEDITYEIRIWNTAPGADGKLIYVRRDLVETYHRIETPLEPGTRYFWSVRPHFRLNGQPRTIEWTLAGYVLRNEAVPNESCLRFQTPAK